MTALASGLRGQALMIERVGQLLFRGSVVLQVEVDDSFEHGSLVIPVHILSEGLDATEAILTGRAVTSIVALLAILSFFGVSPASIYSLFKKLRGRQIKEVSDLPPRLELDISVEQIVRIYNDSDVQKYLRQSLEPLRIRGVDELQTRRNGQIINRVYKSDLEASDAAELEDLNIDTEIELDIEKAAWRKDLAWHFSDGLSSFDAQIDDEDFWNGVFAGEQFSIGDRMRVHLHTTAQRTLKGRLKVTRRIPKVLAVEHSSGRQAKFPDSSTG